ncbi:MAG: hypothetical protein ACK5LG_22145 [Bacteroides thetaiotaomicron]
MFTIIATLCMLSYDGEICRDYKSAQEFKTKAECIEKAKAAREQMPDNAMVRIREIRCERPLKKDEI